MLTSKPPSSSSSKVADAFGGDIASRLLPVAGFAKIPAVVFPTVLTLAALELRVYLVLVLRCDGWRPEKAPRIRTEDLCELLGVTRRRVLLAIAEVVRKGLVRRLTPPNANGGAQYEIVQGTPAPAVIEKDHSAPSAHGSRRITAPAPAVILPLPCEGVSTSYVPDRSFPPDPRARARGGEGRNERNGAAEGAELAAAVDLLLERSDIRSPKLARRELHRLSNVLHGKLELLIVAAEQYCTKQGPWASSAPLYYGVTWIVEHASTWVRSVEKPRRTKPADAAADSMVTVCMLSSAQLVAQERARQKFLAARSMPAWMSGPVRGDTGPAKVAPARSSPEQSGVLRGTLEVAEGGRR